MVGFIIGAVCAIGLIKVLRRRHGWHGRWGYGGPGLRGPRYGGRRRWLLNAVFERLDTTPGQEKAIVGALDELRENRRVVREEAQQTREDLARIVAGGLVDDATLEETFARHDRLLAQLRVSFVESLKKAVEALDEKQRSRVADILRRRGRFGDHVWV
jgi:Spy/CpxP family protein refolding chaperone